MMEDIQKLKTEKVNPLPINPTNYQMVPVDKKETKEESKEKKIEVKNEEVSKTKEVTEEDKKELERNRYMEEEKYNEVRDYFTKVQKYILNDKKDDEKIRTFLKGELSEILEILEEMDSDENSSFFKYDPAYKYFIKLTNKVTDEYIRTNFKEIHFLLDPKNVGKLSILTTQLFADAFNVFCRNIIKEFHQEEGKLEVD
jgi:poly-gamma-glutamate capsule biosynthesis protein CapA/YwtB (metallophosphatase superfamily)